MIYLQVGILILEIGLCYLINNLLKDTLNKKIRYAICIALLVNCWNMRTYQAMWAVHTLFCLLVLLALSKKRRPILCIILSAIVSTSIVTFGYVNMHTIHKTTCNIILDHQPQGTKENIKNNIDLQLSGHTHNEQMFSLSYSYHLQSDFAGNYGKETFKHHTKIISSGLVGWGFPIRTEGICEYVAVNVIQEK